MDQGSSSESQMRQAIQQAVIESYGLAVELDRLPGENMNFLASVSNGRKYVIKVAADDQSEAFIDMEYQALKYASERIPGLQFPSIVENSFGNAETFFSTGDSLDKRLRIIEYLSGQDLEGADISTNLLKNVGQSLALFDQAMEGFDHPAAHRNHRWNLTQVGQHQHSVSLVQDAGKRALLEWAFQQYQKIDSGKLQQLKWQLIHGDPNPENILVEDERVVGLLDFGDSCFNPGICDLAICLPYLMMDQEDPLAVAHTLIEGYESVLPLSALEHECLAPLVLGRLANTLSVATQRRLIEPEHPNWFVSEERAWRLLARLKQLQEVNL